MFKPQTFSEKLLFSTARIEAILPNKKSKVGAGLLRKLNIKVRKVRGIKDQNEILIRLADSMVGFIRDHLEKEKYTLPLYSRAIRNKVLQELK